MTLNVARPPASENLLRTYFALGAAMPGTTIQAQQGYRLCSGVLPHTLCNFAAELSLDPWSVKELKDIAKSVANFNVYLVPGDEPSHAQKLLERTGFTESYRLVQMTSEPRPRADRAPMTEALGPHTREAVARFMAEQFFARQTTSFRRCVAQATAQSELQLHYLQQGGEVIGAAMLCFTPGAVGVYNLCVLPSRRSRGIGGGMVRWCFDLASRLDSKLVLQCEEKLTTWYEELGFSPSGEVIVYSLPK